MQGHVSLDTEPTNMLVYEIDDEDVLARTFRRLQSSGTRSVDPGLAGAGIGVRGPQPTCCPSLLRNS
jgi:hypothetical protein